MELVEIGFGCLSYVRDLEVLGYLKVSRLKTEAENGREVIRGYKHVQESGFI
jgi:hypothetical protein